MTYEKRVCRKPLMPGIVLAAVFLLLIPVYLAGAEPAVEPGMPAYLPRAEELKEWEPVGAPQQAKGEDLFLLINGGAEIYHEYGFSRAIAQGYKKKNQESFKCGFNLEIYEMQNPSAAYGIYTFKTGDSGRVIAVGDGGLLEDYYLNFRKGDFLVTVTGFDSKKETLAGLLETAGIVAAKIKGTGQKPGLIRLLPEDYKKQLKPNGIKYLKGNLALFNYYEFGPGDIFGLKEGVLGDYKDFKLFIFKYEDAEECRERFDSAGKHFKKNPGFKFSGFDVPTGAFYMSDAKGKSLYTGCYQRYIFILKGKKKEEAVVIFNKIREKIANS